MGTADTLTSGPICGEGAYRFSAFLGLNLGLMASTENLAAAAAAALFCSSITALLRNWVRDGVDERGVDPREDSVSAVNSAAEDGRLSHRCGRGSSGVSTPFRRDPMNSTVLCLHSIFSCTEGGQCCCRLFGWSLLAVLFAAAVAEAGSLSCIYRFAGIKEGGRRGRRGSPEVRSVIAGGGS